MTLTAQSPDMQECGPLALQAPLPPSRQDDIESLLKRLLEIEFPPSSCNDEGSEYASEPDGYPPNWHIDQQGSDEHSETASGDSRIAPYSNVSHLQPRSPGSFSGDSSHSTRSELNLFPTYNNKEHPDFQSCLIERPRYLANTPSQSPNSMVTPTSRRPSSCPSRSQPHRSLQKEMSPRILHDGIDRCTKQESDCCQPPISSCGCRCNHSPTKTDQSSHAATNLTSGLTPPVNAVPGVFAFQTVPTITSVFPIYPVYFVASFQPSFAIYSSMQCPPPLSFSASYPNAQPQGHA
ncbi:hypothetical protein SISSUDRAFT_1066458 [Sistotremastrum suecicum HHB10207 ss-3]|uniref:Uncharacterized protein n=1 Tax=Sistotremastrum suecicum HHB10207 ss-3 TaxID=1314776 RepID=A0A165YB37_9AGAM|nr:hypothetical protein SISSUDRAFT_1066458 [Sistotremastrum suecicum HHB10207 ss-3]